jgi:hypothetical protein
MNSAIKKESASSIITEVARSIEELSINPQDYISVIASSDLTLSKITIFGQGKLLASIDFDVDQLDILISRIVAVRDLLSGRK